MNKPDVYKIEHRIHTLATNAVTKKDSETYSSFTVEGVEFEQWNPAIFNNERDFWLAKGEISASNFLNAVNKFRRKLSKIVPRISLISQCFIEYHLEPYFVHKKGDNVFFFQYINNREPTGLQFMEQEKIALEELLDGSDAIPDEFYYYWNDAVNTPVYTAKLALLFSALDALTWKNDRRNWQLIEKILGKRLKKKLYGEQGKKSHDGYRNRLIHGEYFSLRKDRRTEFVEEIHKKVVSYFNTKILSQKYINQQVINPQRNFYANKIEWHGFVKRIDSNRLFTLKELLSDYDERNGWKSRNKYDDNFDNAEFYKNY